MRDDMNRRFLIYDGEDVIEDSMREVDWHEVRAARDQALVDTDWRAGKDVVLSTAWKEYRQALRDLPQDHAESNDAADAWPSPPE
jgi:hypothetical protein